MTCLNSSVPTGRGRAAAVTLNLSMPEESSLLLELSTAPLSSYFDRSPLLLSPACAGSFDLVIARSGVCTQDVDEADWAETESLIW